ncbi:MAG: TetR/AcrR family transcriptional regulator [Bradymonadales bacterium]|nr:TetR/AcrR family transcriptional regulator [Bradymonadales bacterium]
MRPQSNDKRMRILEGALRVFAAKGFYKTRVSEIAKEAGVADGTIYNYFKSKDEILISLFEVKMDGILERLGQELKGGVEERLRKYIEAHLSLAVEDPALAEFITVELRQSDKFLREYKNPKFSQFLRVLSGLIEEGQQLGHFRSDLDARVVARAIFGALDEILLALTWASKSGEIQLAEIANQVADCFLCGLNVPGRQSGGL